MENDNAQQGENTPESQADQSTPAAEDPIKNLKAEMNRKLENTNAQLQALLAAINTPKVVATPVAEPAKKVSVFEDEDAYAARIKAETVAEIRREQAAQQTAQQKQAQTINALISEFPELSNMNDPLTKRAVEIFEALSPDEKASPVAYKAAVKEAALDLDIKPKSKRKAESKADDSFALGGSNGVTKRPPAQTEAEKVRLQLAEAFGLKVTPELKERLNNYAKRDFKRFS